MTGAPSPPSSPASCPGRSGSAPAARSAREPRWSSGVSPDMDATRLVLNTLWFVLHGSVLAPAYLLTGSWRACSSSPSRAGLGLAVTTWSPLGGGVPSGKYRSGAEEGRRSRGGGPIHTADGRARAVLDAVSFKNLETRQGNRRASVDSWSSLLIWGRVVRREGAGAGEAGPHPGQELPP